MWLGRESFIFLLLILASASIFAHGKLEPGDYLPVDPRAVTVAVFLLLLVIALVSIVFSNRLSEKTKKFFFAIIAVSVVSATLYAVGSTVFLNLISETQGPVHWHADFEIWVCGSQVKNLIAAKFPENKVGSELLHHHNDYRIHVEGVTVEKDDVSIGHFFEAIGGELTNQSITIPLDDGTKVTYSNGRQCPNGKPGKLKLLVMNGQTAGRFVEKKELKDYVMSPHFSTIVEGGQGDMIMIVFGEQEGKENGG